MDVERRGGAEGKGGQWRRWCAGEGGSEGESEGGSEGGGQGPREWAAVGAGAG